MKIKNLPDNTPEQEKQPLPIEIFSPWSNIIVKFKIPDMVFKELEKMYDYTMKNFKSFGLQLVGQIEEEPEVTQEIMQKFPKWSSFCLECVNNLEGTTKEKRNKVATCLEKLNQEIVSKIPTLEKKNRFTNNI